jgi:hypothetical protein
MDGQWLKAAYYRAVLELQGGHPSTRGDSGSRRAATQSSNLVTDDVLAAVSTHRPACRRAQQSMCATTARVSASIASVYPATVRFILIAS